MLIEHERLGTRSIPVIHEVERGAIRRYALALGLTNAIHYDVEKARVEGYRDVVAPPTFVVTLLPWNIPGLHLPPAGVLHGEQAFDWSQDSICAGDRIEVTGWVADVKTRGGMHIIGIESEGQHVDRGLAFHARAVLIVTEEVEHASRR